MGTLGIGTITKQDFLIIRNNPISLRSEPVIEILEPTGKCCFQIKVLAESSFTNETKNDVISKIFFFDKTCTNVVMKLQSYINGTWTYIATLNNNTYGTYYSYGFHETIYNEKAVGYKIDFAEVLAEEGEGKYRIKCTAETITGVTLTKYSLEYCLYEYYNHLADETVKIEWYLNGIVGDIDTDEKRNDYGNLNWYNSIRLPQSKFGYDTSETERTFTRYQTTGSQIWTKNKVTPEYTLKTGMFNMDLHRLLQFNVLMGDIIYITDYNSQNAGAYVKKAVRPNGGYAPKWYDNSKYASVEIKFNNYYDNHEHKRC